jgi:hypothetical protein
MFGFNKSLECPSHQLLCERRSQVFAFDGCGADTIFFLTPSMCKEHRRVLGAGVLPGSTEFLHHFDRCHVLSGLALYIPILGREVPFNRPGMVENNRVGNVDTGEGVGMEAVGASLLPEQSVEDLKERLLRSEDVGDFFLHNLWLNSYRSIGCR